MTDITELERKLVIETLFQRYGYDFSGYAASSFDRRIQGVVARLGLKDAGELVAGLLRDREFFAKVLPALTVGTTEMFRDPKVFRAIRDQIVPVLRTYASLNIWVAGCSTGQEAYSMAILLKEEGLLDRSVIFATDINPASLKQAREGIFPADALQVYTRNYIEAGGLDSFSNYYVADYGFARMSPSLTDNMVFSEHNLVTDQVFTEANLILCRNVLIYFDRETQNRALSLMEDTLRYKGFLCLGSKENIKFSDVDNHFDRIDAKLKIYQKHGRVT